jgi:hypothetical protein
MRVAVAQVASGTGAAVVSAGNSGAMLATSLFVLGRLPGIERPAIVTVLPTPSGPLVLCDAGANTEPKPSHLAQFGLLGAAYDRVVHGRSRPRVGLLSNGAEPGKGTPLTRDAHRRVGLLAERLTRVVVHRDDLGRVDDRDARIGDERVEARCVADERDVDRMCGDSTKSAGDLGVGRSIGTHRVEDDADARLGHVASLTDYSSADFFATIVSPRYWPQLMHTRCGTRGAPQLGQAWTVGRFSPDFFIHAERCCAVRLGPRRRFCSAMAVSGEGTYCQVTRAISSP